MKTLGICVGATSIQYVQLVCDPDFVAIEQSGRIPHEGNPRQTLLSFLEGVERLEIERIAVTGRGFRSRLSLTTLPEPEAVEYALRELYGAEDGFPELVVSSGGETQLIYRVSRSGGITSVHSGNKCASGTGEFFMQQIRRMGLSVDEAMALARDGTPHRIAGRCSVFCKSDCTHALNKGAAKADVVAGLCLMMAQKIRELAKDIVSDHMLLIGGGSMNEALVRFLREHYAHVDVQPHSAMFEAFGAAVWAREHECRQLPEELESVVAAASRSYSVHPPLSLAESLVEFKQAPCGAPRDGDRCVVGLDVGSTTTKAVLMRLEDAAILSSIYLRTNGDPIGASRACYEALALDLGECRPEVIGVGVTGSGRQIAGLHALTDAVINEIIAHATAAAYFDPEVDTIFEIGGQDAKYTYLTNGVPSDYAMNEACSAGTGSFLEEAASETLGVHVRDIAELALRGEYPPDFRDECAAFISSDIKRAGQEGVGREDILAGLVYSICLNYMNRVEGARPTGRKVFMQGGVCYNRAVPIAMAACLQAPIVVPPEPGLMGAFGAALGVRARLDEGKLEPQNIDLRELAEREAVRERSFVCKGGAEKCDRKCEINRYRICGRLYPFGGMCDRYYNLRISREVESGALDFVASRQRLVFDTFAPVTKQGRGTGRTVGLCRSFMVHSLYPLFGAFFSEMGFEVVLSDAIDPDGVSRIETQYCLPAQLSHGAFLSLLRRAPDYIFLPQVMQVPVANVPTFSRLCVFAQGEPYYLGSTFRDEVESSPTTVVSAVLQMPLAYEQAAGPLVDMAVGMGMPAAEARKAYPRACERQRESEQALRQLGEETLARIEADDSAFGIVLIGRPYNAFPGEANMGIPQKVASRGYPILSLDMLPADHFPVDQAMFWANGQRIMKAAQFVSQHDKLFGFYITNFSCGPDSFLLNYFRSAMGGKPSLTLELDQHTANAGIDTRIEAALEIMEAWRERGRRAVAVPREHTPAQLDVGSEVGVIDSNRRRRVLTDKDVEVVLPAMGRYGSPAVAAVMRSVGINARVLPTADREALLLARRQATCKECLPYLVTSGSFLKYLQQERPPSRVTLLFIPTGGGPCRLGQYRRALADTIHRMRLRNVAPLSVTDENGYAGMGTRALLRAWQAIVLADVFEDVRSMVTVAAADPREAIKEVDTCWRELLLYFEGSLSVRLTTLLSVISGRLRAIALAKNPDDVPAVSLVGEYFVRKDDFSRGDIVDYLHEHGFMVRVAPSMEYICYSNYNLMRGLQEGRFTAMQRLQFRMRAAVQEWWERRLKSLMAESGLYRFEMTDVGRTIQGVRHLIHENFRGEALLTVGGAMREVPEHSCGVIEIGPFGCMPSRVAEAILKRELTIAGKRRMQGWGGERLAAIEAIERFPFLSIETDGNPFPQIVEANMEAFTLQARRLHELLRGARGGASRHTLVQATPGRSSD